MLGSEQTVVVLQATKDKSLKKASKLEKFNVVLDQALAHIHSFDTEKGNEFLEQEGIIRLSGQAAKINEVFAKMFGVPPADLSGDPGIYPLSDFKSFISDHNNIIGLVKLGLKECKVTWPVKAQQAFEEFTQQQMSFESLIKNLLQQGLNEEAKAFHNLLHLCHIACRYSDTNKMPVSNVGIAIAPSIAVFSNQAIALDDPIMHKFSGGLHSDAQLKAGRERFHQALQNDYFSKSFGAQNPQIEAQMAKEYENTKKYPPIIKPVVFLGFKLPIWLSKIIRAITASKPSIEPASSVQAPVARVPDLPLQAKAQDETVSSPIAPSVAPVQAALPAEVPKAKIPEEPEQTAKKKQHQKREKPVIAKKHQQKREDLAKGLEQFPFEARRKSVTQKLAQTQETKSTHKKKPKKSS